MSDSMHTVSSQLDSFRNAPSSSSRSSSMGSRSGRVVQSSTEEAISKITEALEEMTEFTEDEVEENVLAKRHAKERQDELKKHEHAPRKSNIRNVTTSEETEKFTQSLNFIDADNPDIEMLMRQLRGGSEEISQQFAALEHMKEELKKREKEERAKGASPKDIEAKIALLDEAQEALINSNYLLPNGSTINGGAAIQAGFNTIDEVKKFAQKGLSTEQELRDFYRQTIFGQDNLANTYTSIIQTFKPDKPEKFEKAVEFLIEAIGHDMSSEASSHDSVFLKSVMTDLSQIQVIGGVHFRVVDILERMKRNFQKKGS